MGQKINLTPIEALPYPTTVMTKLKELYIRSVEELIALFYVPGMRDILNNLLPSEAGSFTDLVGLAFGTIDSGQAAGFSPLTEAEISVCMLGLLAPPVTAVLPEEISIESYYIRDLGTSSVNHINKLRPIDYGQGRRGTCVAFGTTVLNEFLHGANTKLSEQFLYWGCKQRDGIPDQSGTWIRYAIDTIRELGQCRARDWPYNPRPGDTEDQGPPPPEAQANAGQYKIIEGLNINAKAVNDLREILLGTQEMQGRVISFGVPVFDSWYRNPLVYRTGRIGMPLPNETRCGGHCMTMVGFEDDSDSPGGGYFIIRNSWEGWGAQSPNGTGYGTIPYAYLALHGWEAWSARNAERGISISQTSKEVEGKPSIEPLLAGAKGPIILGRTSQNYVDSSPRGLLSIGYFHENDPDARIYGGMPVALDICFPHVIFVCGKRGGGKSYTLGVLLEEMARKQLGIATIIIDPMSVFYYMKEPNNDPKEINSLRSLGLEPQGYNNVRILAPQGIFDHRRKPFIESPFSIRVADLTADDWCNVFDLADNRFHPQGMLIEKTIDLVRDGYQAEKAGKIFSVLGKEIFSLEDLMVCIQSSTVIRSSESGFTPSTRRSIAARFQQAASWGIFTLNGTPLKELLLPNWLTVLDVSALETSHMALVVGILARRILQARLAEVDANSPSCTPITWMIIDEAHLFVPRKGSTAASTSLIDYVKRGRKPGCGLVLATQRPAATHDDILSQLDIVVGHNLAQKDDIQALLARIPSRLPKSLGHSDVIRTLPTGCALIADQSMPARAFLCQIRPRTSAHGGKEAQPKV